MLGSYIDLGNPVSDDPLNDGLVSWWLPLENNSGGGTLFDIKGGDHGALGTSTARPEWSAGLNGFGALSYDGGDHVVTSGSNGTLSAITIAAALRPTFASSDTNRRGVFMWTTGTPGAGNPNRHRIIRLSGGYYYDGNSTFAKSFAPTFAANEWHHLIFTASESASAWYFNGRLASSSTGGAFNALGVAPTYLGWDIENAAWKWSGLIGDVRVYPSALSAPEVSALYADWLAGYPRTLRRWRRGVSVSVTSGPITYTATSALTVGSTTSSTSATFAAGTKTATAALIVPSLEIEAVASHTTPTYEADSDVTIGAILLDANATHTAPVYDANAALNVAAPTLDADATHTTPVYEASADLDVAPTTLDADATFSAGTKTATTDLSLGEIILSSEATFSPGTKTASATLSIGEVTLSSSATFESPVYEVTTDLTTGEVTLTASATSADNVFTASSTVSIAGTTFDADTTFAAGTKTATASLTTGSILSLSESTFEAPVYNGSSDLTVGAATLDADAVFAAEIYLGSAALTIAAITLDADVTFTAPVYDATATLVVGETTLTGSATFTSPVYEATAVLTIGAVTADADASFTSGTVTSTASLTTGAATLSSETEFTAPIYSASSDLVTGEVVLSASAGSALNYFTGTAALTIGNVELASNATYGAETVPVIVSAAINFIAVIAKVLNFSQPNDDVVDFGSVVSATLNFGGGSMAAIQLDEINVGSENRIQFTIKKNGVVWDLTTGSVSIKLEKPDRSTSITYSMTADDAENGVFYYDLLSTDIDTVGYWTVSIIVTIGGKSFTYDDEIGFYASSNP